MRIANIMFSRGKGGIEQAFLDYSEALWLAGHDVHALTRPEAEINTALAALPVTRRSIKSYGPLDIYATYALRRALNNIRPDIIIAHGNRALSLSKHASRRRFPIVGVTHNYKIKRLHNVDAVFAITSDLAKEVEALGVETSRIFRIPNMVRLPEAIHSRATHPPLRIGTMGRFVKKKGFHVFIEALRILHEKGLPFQATLAGSGKEEKHLKKQAIGAGLEGVLSFPGWIEDKAAFFNAHDIFCLPSLHEPFGIVLLEALAQGMPVVTTDSEGPSDIVTHGTHALVAPKEDPAALAQTLGHMLQTPEILPPLALAGRQLITERFTLEAVSKQMDSALHSILSMTQQKAG